jgi:hypothetical protein
MKPEPVAFVWSGREMVPLDRFRALASRQYRPGQEYVLIEHRGRSMKAHGLYFKCVEVAWQNLPEKWQKRRDSNRDRFPTAEHLRKWALIQEGYADDRVTVWDTEEDARRAALFGRELDEYAVIPAPLGNVVTIFTAKSQDARMGHDDFQRSMDKVLGRLSTMLGITVSDLTENAKQSMKRIKESS